MNTINNNVVGAFVKATKKVNGKNEYVTLYGMIDGIYCGGESYGLITADLKDGTWTSCLIDPDKTTFLEDAAEIALARKCAQLYCKSEKASIDWRIKRLVDRKNAVAEIEKLTMK